MKKGSKFASLLLLAGATVALTACNNNNKLTGTAAAVDSASKMTLAELEAASKKEWEENPNGKFKVVGLTSVLKSIATTVASKYEWLRYGTEDGTDNIDVNNSYKDYALLTALNAADRTYFADYALVQDARSFSTLIADGLLHNFVPSDALTTIGLKEVDTLPLKGVHFNKLFWTNTNFEAVNGFKLHNIWQMTGSAKTAGKTDYISKVSFQTPVTEQINMSFLLSAMDDAEQARIEAAYEKYFGVKWNADGKSTYASAGQQWVTEFVKNISRWHSSDGTAMKETQLKDDWKEGYVYYGAFAKMKDAVTKLYDVDLNGDGDTDDTGVTVVCDGTTYTYAETKINAMTTVKWDWKMDGFNGFMYCMDSEIINNAQYPYTACLFARIMLDEDSYTTAIYNAKNPDANGDPANQYGYYYPGTASSSFRYAEGDWTKEQHIANELNENYEYLSNVKISTVNSILALAGK